MAVRFVSERVNARMQKRLIFSQDLKDPIRIKLLLKENGIDVDDGIAKGLTLGRRTVQKMRNGHEVSTETGICFAKILGCTACSKAKVGNSHCKEWATCWREPGFVGQYSPTSNTECTFDSLLAKPLPPPRRPPRVPASFYERVIKAITQGLALTQEELGFLTNPEVAYNLGYVVNLLLRPGEYSDIITSNRHTSKSVVVVMEFKTRELGSNDAADVKDVSRNGDIADMKKGCTQYLLSVPPGLVVELLRQSSKSIDNLDEDAPIFRVATIDEVKAIEESTEIIPRAVGSEVASDEKIYEFMASHFEQYEPKAFNIFAWLKESVSILTQIALSSESGLTASVSRFYFVPTLLAKNWIMRRGSTGRATRQAMGHAFIIFPLLAGIVTFALTGMLSLILRANGFPSHETIFTCLWAATSATAVGLAGSIVCSNLYSVLGCGSGTLGFGVMFGLAQFCLAEWAGGVEVLAKYIWKSDPFVAVVNGVIGASASEASTPIRKVIVLLLPSIAIAAAAWLMGRPTSSDNTRADKDLERKLRKRTPRRAIWLTAVAAAFFGLCGIGVIKGLFELLRRSPIGDAQGFCLSAAVAGAIWYTLATRLRTRDLTWVAMISWGLVYAAIGTILWEIGLASRGSTFGLFIIGLGTGWLHACYFTTSYAAGFFGLRAVEQASCFYERRRAAFIAAAIEGVVGFVLFNFLLMR